MKLCAIQILLHVVDINILFHLCSASVYCCAMLLLCVCLCPRPYAHALNTREDVRQDAGTASKVGIMSTSKHVLLPAAKTLLTALPLPMNELRRSIASPLLTKKSRADEKATPLRAITTDKEVTTCDGKALRTCTAPTVGKGCSDLRLRLHLSRHQQ